MSLSLIENSGMENGQLWQEGEKQRKKEEKRDNQRMRMRSRSRSSGCLPYGMGSTPTMATLPLVPHPHFISSHSHGLLRGSRQTRRAAVAMQGCNVQATGGTLVDDFDVHWGAGLSRDGRVTRAGPRAMIRGRGPNGAK